MNGRDFERQVLKLLQAQGFVAEITKATADGGIDIVAKRTDPLLAGKYIVQCKNWTKPVGAPVVRDLYGVITAENANKGILITTSRFTDSARAFAEDKPLELIDGQMWSDLLAERPDADFTAELEITSTAVDVREYDPLFSEAKALVMRHERASATFLMRRLGIGYPRAARLIEQLEEAGVVGPMESGGRSRKVLVRDEKWPVEQDTSEHKKRRPWWHRLVGR